MQIILYNNCSKFDIYITLYVQYLCVKHGIYSRHDTDAPSPNIQTISITTVLWRSAGDTTSSLLGRVCWSMPRHCYCFFKSIPLNNAFTRDLIFYLTKASKLSVHTDQDIIWLMFYLPNIWSQGSINPIFVRNGITPTVLQYYILQHSSVTMDTCRFNTCWNKGSVNSVDSRQSPVVIDGMSA